MKLLTVILMCLIGMSAHADFFSGVVVGSVMSSGDTKDKSNNMIASDKAGRDVIVCCTGYSVNNTKCSDVRYTSKTGRTTFEDLTPGQFAKYSGYDILYKTGFLKTGTGCNMIVMEVGRK